MGSTVIKASRGLVSTAPIKILVRLCGFFQLQANKLHMDQRGPGVITNRGGNAKLRPAKTGETVSYEKFDDWLHYSSS